jgi:hypothetical protein
MTIFKVGDNVVPNERGIGHNVKGGTVTAIHAVPTHITTVGHPQWLCIDDDDCEISGILFNLAPQLN